MLSGEGTEAAVMSLSREGWGGDLIVGVGV